MLTHTPVKSSSIASVAHDPESKTLEVKFTNGGHYTATGPDVEDHAQFIGAESMGRHFNQVLRKKFTFTKVDA